MVKPFGKTKSPALLLLPLCLLLLKPASAQEGLPDSEIQNRLQYIQTALARGESNADLWWKGWLIGYGAATVGQGSLALISKDKETRQDMALGAATTALGVVGQVIAPMVPGSAPDRLAGIPEGSPAERREKLAKAEALLRASAECEREGRSWKAHALSGAVNLTSGLVVWLGFNRTALEGFGNFLFNTAFTEAQIWTQPTRAVRDYDDYMRKIKIGSISGLREPDTEWRVAVYPGGIGINITF
jgi:hypothetical protein